PDEELVADIARGRIQSLAKLYDRYCVLTLAVAQRMLTDRAQAEDAVQELFEQIWRHAHSYDPERGTVRTWILMRLRSRILNYLRSARVRRETSSDDPAAGEPAERPHTMEAQADRENLRRALLELSPAQRSVVELAYFQGLTCAEIAARTEAPLGTVKSRLAGALKKLTLALRPNGDFR
nr:sigma-70 family RNA polymerase sigma factor [Deltaproteobacteria bacterium]